MKKIFKIGVVAALAISSAVSAVAQGKKKEFNPYISVQANAEYIIQSEEVTGGDSQSDAAYSLTDAILGFEYSQDKLSGTFELVLADDNLAEIGLAFAEYESGSVTYMFGLNDSPYTYLARESAFEGSNFLGFGASTEDVALLQAQASFKGFYGNIMQPNLPTNDNGDNEIGGIIIADYDMLFPKITLGYAIENDTLTFGAGASVNMFGINDGASAVDGEAVLSYLIFAHGSYKAGIFVVNANLGYSVNAAEFGLAENVAAGVVIDGDELKDTTTIEGFIEAGVEMDTIGVFAGVGYVQADNDTYAEADAAMAYFVQAPITINEYFTLTPEVAYHDLMDDSAGNSEGNQMSFSLFAEMAL